MENLYFLFPVFGMIFWILLVVIIISIIRKKRKPVTMEKFAKNPFGNLFSVAFDGIAQISSLNNAFQAVISNPCQTTADELLAILNGGSDAIKITMSNGNGVNTSLWKNTFNSYIVPSTSIRKETKIQIREALIRLSVDHLYVVRDIRDTDAIGREGEENVWFTLTQLASRGIYKVFANVRLPYKSLNQDSQEIDAIVVGPKGVFLIEVKSVSRTTEAIKYYDISNPSQQICMHEEAFQQNFGDVFRKNLLVVSYSKNERAKVDLSTFPNNSAFVSMTVDDLYQYIHFYDGADVLDEVTIDAICKKIMSNSLSVGKAILDPEKNEVQTANPVSSATAPVQSNVAPKFCPNCGNKLVENSQFCPNCGAKLQ